MIIIENAPRYAVYCRTNRRVKWQFAKYVGCFDTVEAAVESIKEHLPGQAVQYLVQDDETGEENIGDI